MAELKPCKCGGEVHIGYACGEYFITCENDCMDIPPCFHSSEKATAEEWNRRANDGNLHRTTPRGFCPLSDDAPCLAHCAWFNKVKEECTLVTLSRKMAQCAYALHRIAGDDTMETSEEATEETTELDD